MADPTHIYDDLGDRYCQEWDDETEWDDDHEPDECEHENAEYDVIEGRMWCTCGYHRWLTGDEIRREAQFQAEQMEAYFVECNRDG